MGGKGSYKGFDWTVASGRNRNRPPRMSGGKGGAQGKGKGQGKSTGKDKGKGKGKGGAQGAPRGTYIVCQGCWHYMYTDVAGAACKCGQLWDWKAFHEGQKAQVQPPDGKGAAQAEEVKVKHKETGIAPVAGDTTGATTGASDEGPGDGKGKGTGKGKGKAKAEPQAGWQEEDPEGAAHANAQREREAAFYAIQEYERSQLWEQKKQDRIKHQLDRLLGQVKVQADAWRAQAEVIKKVGEEKALACTEYSAKDSICAEAKRANDWALERRLATSFHVPSIMPAAVDAPAPTSASGSGLTEEGRKKGLELQKAREVGATAPRSPTMHHRAPPAKISELLPTLGTFIDATFAAEVDKATAQEEKADGALFPDSQGQSDEINYDDDMGSESDSDDDDATAIDGSNPEKEMDMDHWRASVADWAFYARDEDTPPEALLGWFNVWGDDGGDTVREVSTLLCAARDKFQQARGGAMADAAHVQSRKDAGDDATAAQMQLESDRYSDARRTAIQSELDAHLRAGVAALVERRIEDLESGVAKQPEKLLYRFKIPRHAKKLRGDNRRKKDKAPGSKGGIRKTTGKKDQDNVAKQKKKLADKITGGAVPDPTATTNEATKVAGP